MIWIEIAYRYIWYYTQWWIRKTHLRRPYTFIMRDHPWAFWLIPTPLLGAAAYFAPYRWELMPGGVWFMLLAHLWWGSKIVPGQQEEPCFDPLHPIKSVTAIRENRRLR